MTIKRHNWEQINETIASHIEHVRFGQPFWSIAQLADKLGLPYGTVYDAYGRGDIDAKFVQDYERYEDEEDIPEVDEAPSVQMGKNEAIVKYNAAEPLEAPEVMALAGIDPNEWKIAGERINLWQMGRKAKRVDLSWHGGKASGYVEDSGEINKTYLYQIELKLERVKRIAVEPIIRPIVVGSSDRKRLSNTRPSKDYKVMFIADPHFGFVRSSLELRPFHVRKFLSDLIDIAAEEWVDEIVWSGDVLDLADFSRFDSDPNLLFTTQLAAIELAHVLRVFGELTGKQTILEGNHDLRLQTAMSKNMASAFELKPVHELGEEPLMSIPRLLGLKELGIDWVPGYPDNQYKVGDIIFEHGNVSRTGSARTIAYLLRDAVVSKFFGHIHRLELAPKYVHDLGATIWVGSPGCACHRAYTPGSKAANNWHVGAFIIHVSAGLVSNVEIINHDLDYGTTIFRGQMIDGESYMESLLDTVPQEWVDEF